VGLNVHVYPSPFEFESRILKVTKTLVSMAIVGRVLVIATAKEGLPERQVIDEARQVLRVRTRLSGTRVWSKALGFVEWTIRVLGLLRREPIEMVNCHSLSALPLCVLIKWRHRALLIYEPHELETETVTSTMVRRMVAKLLERVLIRQAGAVIVVSDSIATHYCDDYGLSVAHVVLNVPESTSSVAGDPSRLIRDRFGIPDSHLLFMYQGVLSETRGVSVLLRAFQRVRPDRHLVFMGFGPLERAVASAAASLPNLHFHPPVPPGEIMQLTRGADVGFALLSDTCVNHRCALPNKLFQYLHAGLPVVVSNLEEMANLTERYSCGWPVDFDETSLALTVSEIDLAAIEARRAGVRRAQSELTWGHETQKLVSIYREILPTRVPAPTQGPNAK